MKVKILLNEIAKINKIISIVKDFTSEIDLISGKYLVDAKSLMGVYSLDLSEPVFAEIHSSGVEELNRFKQVMEEFRVD